MKISNNFYINNFQKTNFKKQQKNNTTYTNTLTANLPSTSQYLAFMGGYSINLQDTFQNLDSSNYPSKIETMVQEELNNKNPNNKTLYDIHFEKYKGILDCYSLEELKEKYPEFNDVVSVYDTISTDDSFIGKFKSGDSEVFSLNEDLTLQLIKLYWGQGFSLNDLSKYVQENSKDNKGFNFYHVMKKLNIPTMNSRYAGVLKLSNKEYNEKFTAELAIKILEAKEAKIQKEEGEPIVIPRGPLSEAHKKHISEGLKRYYQTNPEKIYEMSKRQEEFYKLNPNKKEELSQVLLYAWNKTNEGKSVRKHLNKFLKKYNNISEKQLLLQEELTRESKNALKTFWDKNPWAKKSFSTAMLKGWDYVKFDVSALWNGKSVLGEKFSFNMTSRYYNQAVLEWAKKKGMDASDVPTLGVAVLFKDETTGKDEKSTKLLKRACKLTEAYNKAHPQVEDMIATALEFTIISIYKDLIERSSSLPSCLFDNPKGYEEILKTLSIFIKAYELISPMGGYRYLPKNGVVVDKLVETYKVFAAACFRNDFVEMSEYMNNKLDNFYKSLMNDENTQQEFYGRYFK